MGISGWIESEVNFEKNTTEEQKDSFMKKVEELAGYRVGWDDPKKTEFKVSGYRIQWLEFVLNKIKNVCYEFDFIDTYNSSLYKESLCGASYNKIDIESYAVIRLNDKNGEEIDNREIGFDELETYLKQLKEESILLSSAYVGNAYFLETIDPKYIVKARDILLKAINPELETLEIEWEYCPDWADLEE